MTVTEIPRRPSTAPPVADRQHTPLSAINPRGSTAVRTAGRTTDIPGRRPVRPLTFNSAL